MKFRDFVILNNLGEIDNNHDFKTLTTIGVGGKINILYLPNSIKSLACAYKFIKKRNLKYVVLGNGSNILASDNDYDGIVISLKKIKQSFIINEGILTVSAGYSTIKLAYELGDLKLGDLSFLGGIPGTVGGAIYNNSGSYGDCVNNYLISVQYIDTKGEIIELKKDDLMMGYRHSIFHYFEGIIISAKFKVKHVETMMKLEDNLLKRKSTQPMGEKSMGSVFKNNSLIPSYKIIDFLNMRGFSFGDAEISNKHSNFIVNKNDAKSEDVLKLIELIQKRASLELGINLAYEITLIY